MPAAKSLCEVCNKQRISDMLSAYTEDISYHFQLPPGTVKRTVWYCIDKSACINGAQRLVLEELQIWKDRGVMSNTVAIDFDGTLAKYHAWVSPTHFEEPFAKAAGFTQLLRTLGIKIVIHSCRTNPELNGPAEALAAKQGMIEWLDKHGFAYDSIWMAPGKPIAAAYVDDRGVSCCPNDGEDAAYAGALSQIKRLCGIA